MGDIENLEQDGMLEDSEDTEETIQIRNPRWNDSEHTSFDCELNHPEYGWIPFTVKGNDTSYYCSELWKNKDSFDIQEFVPVQEDIDALKEQKHQELRTERDKLRQIEFAVYADNILRTLSPEQITELGRAMKTKVEEIYSRYWYARDVLLVNAQTKEEIQSITILSN